MLFATTDTLSDVAEQSPLPKRNSTPPAQSERWALGRSQPANPRHSILPCRRSKRHHFFAQVTRQARDGILWIPFENPEYRLN
jgi:hypothetical protein